jgi:hypothetical protein
VPQSAASIAAAGSPGFFVCQEGACVVDGALVRLLIGAIGGGDYGVKISDSSGQVVINGSSTIPAGVTFGITQTSVSASGIKVNDGTYDRVILGAIGGGDYGLKVVSSDGSTVIVDGKSDMFKIGATGTQTRASNATPNYISTTIGAITGLSTSPMVFYTVADASSQASGRVTGSIATYGPAGGGYTLYAATGSGGSPTKAFFPPDRAIDSYTQLSAGSPVVNLVVNTPLDGVTYTAYQRYYVLTEVSI